MHHILLPRSTILSPQSSKTSTTSALLPSTGSTMSPLQPSTGSTTSPLQSSTRLSMSPLTRSNMSPLQSSTMSLSQTLSSTCQPGMYNANTCTGGTFYMPNHQPANFSSLMMQPPSMDLNLQLSIPTQQMPFSSLS